MASQKLQLMAVLKALLNRYGQRPTKPKARQTGWQSSAADTSPLKGQQMQPFRGRHKRFLWQQPRPLTQYEWALLPTPNSQNLKRLAKYQTITKNDTSQYEP